MCEGIDPFTPSAWNENCATGTCPNCPSRTFPVPPDLAGTNVSFSLWSLKTIDGKKKYGLWQVTKSIEDLSLQLAVEVPKLIRHIFTAAVCWEKRNANIKELRLGLDLMTEEDYQRNFELSHAEQPTSMAYSANSIQIAMYPVALRYRKADAAPDSTPEQAAVIFLTPDRKHDGFQVEDFGKR